MIGINKAFVARIAIFVGIASPRFLFSAACPSVPAEPACPSSGTTTMVNSSSTKLDKGKVYVMSGTSYTAGNMDESGFGTGTTSIYICNGQTITINQINTQTSYTYYVLKGATLNLDGNFNGSTFYIYGTVNYTGSGDFSYQTNGQVVYIGRTGYLNLAGKTLAMNSTGGFLINEGFLYAGDAKVNNGQMCINNSGCTQLDNITTNDVLNYLVNDNGGGYIFYNNTTKPTINKVLTNNASLQVCTRQSASYSLWNNATVSYGCTSPNWSCSNPLYITLTFFRVKKSENGALITWGTNLQRNTAYFMVEKSQDGYAWEEVEQVSAQGDKNVYSEYALVDPHLNYGTNYYRLTEVDNNGKRTIYAVDLLVISSEGLRFFVYPNPSDGNFSVYVGSDFSSYDLELEDLAGMHVGHYTLVAGKNDLSSAVGPGTYLFKLKVGPDTKIQKVVIR